jgi:sodium-dependent dicarboxylate transporter 2/3/5
VTLSQDTEGGENTTFGTRQRVGLALGPIAFLVMIMNAPAGFDPLAWRTAIVAVVMAIFWVTEAIPIAVTALFPLAMLPVLGVSDIAAAASPYANEVIFLFMGGFILAKAMERWRLHQRIALWTISAVGTRPRQMVGGLMAATGLISMWVSNTATTVMMLPIGISIIHLVEKNRAIGGHASEKSNFSAAVMLGIAYAASIGGLGTLIGTPPNALFAGFIRESYGITISFAQYMMIGVPIVLVVLPLTWLMLTRVAFPIGTSELPDGRALIQRELAGLGSVSRGEWTVAVIFGLTTLLWVTRPLLAGVLPQLSDAGIAVSAAVLLFLVPIDFKRGVFALDWESAKGIPWDVLLLFGGGLSLAAAISKTGLAGNIGNALRVLDQLPLVVVILSLVAVVCLLSELASNTATAAAFLPVAAALALALNENPLLITLATALGASLGFMLPVATPPNAIVYGTGYVTVPQMTRAGLWLDVLCIIVASVAVFTVGAWALDIQLGVVPPWAVR